MKGKGRDAPSLSPSRLACVVLLLISVPLHSESYQRKSKNPVIFNFGDSNSDTGGLVAGLGFPVNLPNGRTFFRRSTGRLCDGRLVIDFLCQSLNTSYLSPYLDSLGGWSFTNGANFAIVGSSTLPKYVPFSLNIQVMQFLRFKARSLEITAKGSTSQIDEEGFHNALYMIDIGQNDLSDSFSKNLSYAGVIKRIPFILAEIKYAVASIYNQGGRNFWIHNTGPLGCLPQKLSLVLQKNTRDLDRYGCLIHYNEAAMLFNAGLNTLCKEMRSELKNATVVYIDIYAIKYDLIANPSKYGFANPVMACCGYGGTPYNYNIKVTCGQVGSNVCENGSQYVSWDGIHYTEAANAVIASKILSTAYSTPPLKLDFFNGD